MSAPLQPPRQMAVQLVGFLGLPWRIWGYLGSTLFLWGFLVLVLFPVGLLGKVILILMPFLGAVCLAWPRGGRHVDEWLVLAWGYSRAKHRAKRRQARHRPLIARATSRDPEERSLAPWEALPSFEAADALEAEDLDEEAPPWAEEPAAGQDAWEDDADLRQLPEALVFAGRPLREPAFHPAGRLPRSSTALIRPHDTDLDWDEETGTFFDTPGAYLLDVGLRHAGPARPRPPSHEGRIIPMPMPMPRPHQHAVGHEE